LITGLLLPLKTNPSFGVGAFALFEILKWLAGLNAIAEKLSRIVIKKAAIFIHLDTYKFRYLEGCAHIIKVPIVRTPLMLKFSLLSEIMLFTS
jgi:hypothetical protein